MSYPQNPLNYFRSYAYHHILVACDGTETAEQLAKDNKLSQFEREEGKMKFCPQRNSKGRYVVLINGTSDAQFIIKSAKWSSVLIPNDDPAGEGTTHFRTMAVDGELEILEPMGVNFFNLLNEVTKLLKTDANGVVFVLKTIFVGHRHDERTEVISNIRPLMFIMYDINAAFDVTGAEYQVSFVGVTNGAARLPHVSAVADGFIFEMSTGATLETTFMGKDGLADQLNNYYVEQKKAIANQAVCNGVKFDFYDEFFDVEYAIELHPDYNSYHVGTGELAPKQNTGDGDAIIKKGNSISVEGIIDAIMMSSEEVVTEGKKEDGKQYMHKITSTIDTAPGKYKITYHIQRFESVVTPVEKFLDFEPPNGTGIAFDYIFTGKNIDIKTFDIKMNMGMAFFQTLASTPSLPKDSAGIIAHYNPTTKVAGVGNKESSGDQKNTAENICDDTDDDAPRKKPFFLGMSLKDSSLRNKRLPGPASSYSSLLMRHAAYENIEARIVIHGNPQLLEETTQLPSDMSPLSEATPGVIQVDGADDLRNLWPAVHRIPGYAKVNVHMPNAFMANKDDMYADDYSQPFWYTGWYFVYGINHVFSEGEFTQEIEMFSIPTDASQSNLGSSKENCSGESEQGGVGSNQNGAGTTPAGEDPADEETIIAREQRFSASANQPRK